MANYKIKSNNQEKRIAKDIQGKVTIASGALFFQKADVRNNTYLVECKTTQDFKYSLTKRVWTKICKEALRDNLRIPLLCIDVCDSSPNTRESLVVMDYNDALFLPNFKDFKKCITCDTLELKSSLSISAKPLYGIDYSKNSLSVPIAKIKFGTGYLALMYWSDFVLLGGTQ